MKKYSRKNVTKDIKMGSSFETQHGVRFVVAGKAYGEEKFLTVDEEGKLKSRVCDTMESLLDGYKISDVQNTSSFNIDDSIEVGDVFLVQTKNHGVQKRMLCGGKSYGQVLYFTVDENMHRRSRILHTIAEVLEGYEILGVLKQK